MVRSTPSFVEKENIATSVLLDVSDLTNSKRKRNKRSKISTPITLIINATLLFFLFNIYTSLYSLVPEAGVKSRPQYDVSYFVKGFLAHNKYANKETFGSFSSSSLSRSGVSVPFNYIGLPVGHQQ